MVPIEHQAHAIGHAAVLLADRGAVAQGPEVADRLAADRAYIDALRQERNRSTRVWVKTGCRALTIRT